ncbi:MAG: BatA domain-containing protein [Planctomycetota bacterium]
MNFAFGSPLMLWGAALIAVPLLIHLLNRRRFVVQPFAAMRFLQEAFAQRRRRLRLESLLLLLLRCLLVLLAALAMALPFVPEDSPLALVTGGRREVVVLLDRSGSMGRLVAPGVTADDRALSSLRRRLDRLSDDRGDAVSLVFLGGATALPAPIGAPPSMAVAALEGELPAPAGVADFVAAARFVRDRVRAARPGRLDILILSDLQRLSWTMAPGALGSLFGETFATGGGSLRLLPTVGTDLGTANLGVLALEAQEPLLLSGEPVSFAAVVRNWSENAAASVEGVFLLDGEPRGRQRLELAPLGEATATVRLRIDTPGPHHLSFRIDADELPLDDARTLAFELRQALDVLLVDGAPGDASPLSGATDYLRLALAPEELDGRYRPNVVEASRLDEAGAALAAADAIVLADVGAISATAAESLALAVRAGTPLLIFLGENVDSRLWEERLLPLGLLPARIGAETLGDPGGRSGEDYVTLALPEPAPAALALFSDPRLSVLLDVPIFAWRRLEPLPETQVLASFADSLGRTEPALVEGRLGRGRILLCGTSADTRWSLLPRNPALWVPLVHELLSALVAPEAGLSNVPVGQGPSVVVDGVPTSAQLTWPSRAVTSIDRPDVVPLDERSARKSLLRLEGTPLDEPGAYLLEVRSEAAGARQNFALAAYPDAREGDLRLADETTLDAAFAGVEWERGEEAAEDEEEPAAPGDGSLAAALLWALLGAALLESLLARSLGAPR